MEVKKKVVIVENDQDIREIVAFILEDNGFDTFSLPEPSELSSLIAFAPDVILLDEFINGEPGHRLCRKIKRTPSLADVPVIILSTAANIELIARECEANDHLAKPFDVEELVAKVTRLLDHQPLAL